MPPIDEDIPLPPSAMARLTAPDRVWTSELSVDDMVALAGRKLSPVGVVLGTVMQPAGLQPQRWTQSVELGMLSDALRLSRATAVARLQAEADALDADGVVGVRMSLRAPEGAADMVEVLAQGTAVGGGKLRTAAGKPFTTHLSGVDVVGLLGAGMRPVAVVAGVCVYHVAHQAVRGGISGYAELPVYSQALYDARELALARLQTAAAEAGGTGVVGVEVEVSPRGWGPHAVEVVAAGTAVS